MNFICSLFGHHRSRKHARRRGGEWHSVCQWCGAPMARAGPKNWSVVEG